MELVYVQDFVVKSDSLFLCYYVMVIGCYLLPSSTSLGRGRGYIYLLLGVMHDMF